ncbi:hypothetical protein E2C01_020958 [Portunus trituberculatus]|uniref:Uncharacterized protein n=1 Tax=Portunus trituberculatus TaxID=210409 RepID=A0A5B7E2X7_PORTR|nr:hypothetical protein [Portunus trituberculatus]
MTPRRRGVVEARDTPVRYSQVYTYLPLTRLERNEKWKSLVFADVQERRGVGEKKEDRRRRNKSGGRKKYKGTRFLMNSTNEVC